MKTILIGIDGATFELIKPYASQNHLPTFKALLATSTHSELNSTIPPITVPATPTILTGCNPGKHNMYAFMRRGDDTYDEQITTVADRKVVPIWKILERNRKTTGSFLMPYTSPPEKTKGYIISGFGTSDFSKAFNPRELRDELKQNVPEYETFEKLKEEECTDRLQYIRKDLTDVSKASTAVVKYLIKNKPTDLLMVWMDECEKAHHQGWKYCDPRFSQYHSFGSEEYHSVIRENYQNVDASIGDLLCTVDDDTNVIIMSDHGFGATYKNSSLYNTNDWLAKEGYLVPKKKTRRLGYDRISSLVGTLKLNAFLRKRISRKLMTKISGGVGKDNINWSETKAYCAGNNYYTYLNLKGREPDGIVEPEEYESVRLEIMGKLASLKDKKSGRRILKKIAKGEDVFHGPWVKNAPDIIALPNELTTEIKDGMIVKPEGEIDPDPKLITIQHKQKGILILKGPAFKQNATLRDPQMQDIMPTMLYLLDVPVPRHVDGRVLTEAIKDEYLAEHPIRHEEPKEDIGDLEL